MNKLHLMTVSLLLVASVPACVSSAEDDNVTGGHTGPADPDGTVIGPPEATGRTAVHFPEGGLRIVNYDVYDGRAIIEGDIDIGAAEDILEVAEGVELKDLPAQAWTSLGATKWTSGTINYQAPSLDHLGTTRYNAVYTAIARLINETHIDFQLVSSSSSANRIIFTNAIFGASSSPVGMQGGAQYVRLTLDADVTTIMHEILHAAGFWHEQSRTDRGSYIDINWICIEPGREHNFESHTGLSNVSYDTHSIMHYRSTAFVRDDIAGCTWTIRRENGTMIPRNTSLSSKDVDSINLWY
jgi:hypothetical protein